MLAIHGLGDSAEGFTGLVEALGLPFRFIVPDAPSPRSGGGFSWYRIRSPKAAADVKASTGKLVALIEEVRKRWPEAPAPLVLGFSQGGVMGFSLAARHPDLVRGVVAIAGYLIPDDLAPAGQARPPLLVIHGTADRTVTIDKGRAAAARFEKAGYPVEIFEHPGGHRIPREALARTRGWLSRVPKTPAAR